MHLAIGSAKNGFEARIGKSNPAVGSGKTYAVEEIKTYIAIRDQLLAEAEQMRTRAKLESVIVANDVVANCLRPTRPVYQAQSLPETEAMQERQRCAAVTDRVKELRLLEIRANPFPKSSLLKS